MYKLKKVYVIPVTVNRTTNKGELFTKELVLLALTDFCNAIIISKLK
jgi:hypothetical protein